jgi:hypothetical protein
VAVWIEDQGHGVISLEVKVKGFENCCMSGKMTELEDKGEVENIGSEHERCEH